MTQQIDSTMVAGCKERGERYLVDLTKYFTDKVKKKYAPANTEWASHTAGGGLRGGLQRGERAGPAAGPDPGPPLLDVAARALHRGSPGHRWFPLSH